MERRDAWRRQLESLGELIRSQRRLADLSMRELAQRARISNPYLSQIERGLHEPSIHVINAIARALDISADQLLGAAGMLEDKPTGDRAEPPSAEAAILADPALTDEQKAALLTVYRSYVAANR